MDVANEAGRIVASAEREIKQLISSAADQGLYSEIPRLAELAEKLASVASSLSASWRTVRPSQVDGFGRHVADLDVARTDDASSDEDAPSANRAVRYPRFLRRGNNLLKVGWSNSTSREYEHRAGKAIVDSIVIAMAEIGASKKRFSVDELGTLTYGDGYQIPSYQVYLVIAWLRAEKLLEHYGRRGYTIREHGTFRDAVAARWESLHTGAAESIGSSSNVFNTTPEVLPR